MDCEVVYYEMVEMTNLNVPFFSSFFGDSWVEVAISYKLCYSVDKKGYRKRKIIWESIGGLEKCSNFADEFKGTIFLVITAN